MLHPLLFLFLLQVIRLFVQLHVLPELLLQHMQLLLCSIFCLRAIFMSTCHFIVRVSKVAFIINWPAWACNLVLPLCCQQPSSCIHCIWYAAFSCYSWCCSLWCCCCHILTSLSMNNLMCSWVGKSMDNWSIASPSVLWMVSSSLLSWKPLYRYYWEVDEYLGYLETWKCWKYWERGWISISFQLFFLSPKTFIYGTQK